MTFTNWINRSYLSRLYLSNVGNVNGTKPCLYTMSKDGLLPNSLVKFKFNPSNQFFFMVFVSLFAGFVPVSDLGHMVSIGTLLASF
jgi:hypothetical protein